MKTYRIHKLDIEQFKLWDKLLDESQISSPFLYSFWLRSYSKIKNIQFEILGCFDKNEELVAGFGYYFTKKFKRFNLIVNYLGVENCIVYATRETKLQSKKETFYFTIFKVFLRYLETKYNHIEFTFNHNMNDVRPFKWKGYKYELRYTYFGEIKQADEMLQSFNPDIRNKIKKARRLNFNIDKSNSDLSIKNSYSLIERSLRKNGHKHPLDRNSFIYLVQTLRETGIITTYLAYIDDIPACVRIIVKNKIIAKDFQAGGNEELYNSGINQLLSYEIFKDLYNQGIRYYDFVGANNPSVAKYKANFNLNLVPYLHLEKNRGIFFTPLMKLKKVLF